jgi:two-component system, chemotaxis family, CheB/CheR fusion protein
MQDGGSQREFPIVGLGASAGGIGALKTFFSHMPPDSGMAFVVIVHLSPQHESHLAQVVQVSTAMPVAQVQTRVRVEPNCVYVVPPNRSLAMLDGHLDVSEIRRIEERRAPIDIFFRTLADTHGSHAIAVVLSGTGADGSMGLKRIKEEGGICLVQEPSEAEYSEMSRNSIATGLVDHILPVAELPSAIVAFREHLAALPPPATSDDTPGTDEATLREIFAHLRSRTGHDLCNYKRPTLRRRIGRRMAVHGMTDLRAYTQLLRERPDELQALLKDVLISVTHFYRDSAAFDVLERKVIPSLFAGKDRDDQVRVWVAACATGEEAYSIAMLLAEHAETLADAPKVQVFATDIDPACIAIARQGVYTLTDIADVSVERLQRFFTKEDDCYRVRKELRELALFSEHNIIKDPPFSHLDFASCRNLLIYLNRAGQRRVMEVLHYALRPGLFLFLGGAESADVSDDLFGAFDRDAHIYQSRTVSTRLGLPNVSQRRASDIRAEPPVHPGRTAPATERTIPAEVHQRLLEEYAAPSLLVDADHDVVHLSDRAAKYLRFAGGTPSHSLWDVIHPDLLMDLRSALSQAEHHRKPVQARGVTVGRGPGSMVVNVTVRPMAAKGDGSPSFFLVLFEESGDGKAQADSEVAIPVSRDETVRQLEAQVLQLKTQLRSTIEGHDHFAADNAGVTEELQAVNEELRSSSEELETSKEELQSLNEELQTVNQELKLKIEEQTRFNDDLQNLVHSTEIGTIFLDRELNVKLFTPAVRSIFNLIPADRGRPLSDITTVLEHSGLHQDLARVMETLERVEREVLTRDGRWLLMRAHPYRTSDDRIDGVVLTFVDVTSGKNAEARLQRSEARLRLVLESVADYAIYTMDLEGRVESWNAGAARIFGYAEDEIIGQPAIILATIEDRERGADREELRLAHEQGKALDERWHLRRNGSCVFVSGILAPLLDTRGLVVGYVKVARDLTERKHWEDALQKAHDALETRVQERTADLAAANRSLDVELRERRQAEAEIRELLKRILTVQEDERRRIARDLHDHLGQQVAGLSLKLEALQDVAGTPAASTTVLEEARAIISRLDKELDFFTWELRPAALDDFGLVAALGTFINEWSRTFGVAADFHSTGLDDVRLSFDAETNLYRISQEALNNVHKHAAATRVGVILERRGEQVVLIIEDDGHGFEDDEAGAGRFDSRVGLRGIRERAVLAGGRAEIETAPGKGTTIFVRVPTVTAERRPSAD